MKTILIILLILIFTPHIEAMTVTRVYEIHTKKAVVKHSESIQKKPEQKLSDRPLNNNRPNNAIEDMIKNIFKDDASIALAIAHAESGMRCEAHGDRDLDPSSYGVFQIRAFKGRPSTDELLDCNANIAYAKVMYDRQGWSPWSTYKSGSYKKFLSN
jgi:hypothetical protein